MPVPETAITSGLLVVESLMITVPPRVPVAVGVKVTEILQVVPGAMAVVQEVPWIAKSPFVTTLEIVNDEACSLVTPNTFGALVVPTATVPEFVSDVCSDRDW